METIRKAVALASDHAGFGYKEVIKNVLKDLCEVRDFGTFSQDSVDYPDFVHPAAQSVEKGECGLGILICGSGNGVQITANKYQKVRCALCWNTEVAELSRRHNNANMLAIPARFISEDLAVEIVKTFLEKSFDGGRHQCRVDKITSP